MILHAFGIHLKNCDKILCLYSFIKMMQKLKD